jgi:uncharacterized membrane protein
MTDAGAARDITKIDRVSLQALVCRSLEAKDFRAGLAPLCRLLLTLDHRDPERPLVLACLAVVYARIDRPEAARRTLRCAEAAARGARAASAVQLAKREIDATTGSE